MDKPIIRRVAVLGGTRIPFCRSNTKYSNASNLEMLTAAMQGLVNKYSLNGEVIGEATSGAVLKHSWDWNMTREAVLSSGLAPETPAYDLQMACGTSLQAALNLGGKIATGQLDSAIAAGVDTTSDAPVAVSDNLRDTLMNVNRARTTGDRLKALAQLRPKDLIPKVPDAGEKRTRMSMGQHCEEMVKEWGIAREDQDQLAYESHIKTAKAYEEGWMSDLIVPFKGVKVDNNLRPDSTIEKMATLKPAFDKKSGKGTLTAANSTPLTDGASAALLSTEEWAKARGIEPLAYLTYGKTAAVNFTGDTDGAVSRKHLKDGKEGLLMAPAYAVAQMLKDADLTLQDFDFYEIHEAFAGQVLCTLKAWEDADFCKNRLGLSKPLGSIDRSKLNVKGSSLATGHPFAATGARILANAAKLLADKGQGRCLISVCTAGGMGVTAILER